MKGVAEKNPNIQFCHATGVSAEESKLANFHNAFASIYEGRYLAGVAAGLKLNEMIANGTITAEQAKMGYVGAFTYAEVISGYTAFYLGAKSVCPTVTMDVKFTGSWYDLTAEKKPQKHSSKAAAKSSANTQTPWVHRPHVKEQASPTCPTTAAPLRLAPKPSSFLPESIGHLTSNTSSLKPLKARKLTPTGPAL